jgi:hypothetical protein
MKASWNGVEQRRSPRIDVRMRVKGELSLVEAPLLVHDLSRTGFAVVSTLAFDAGEALDFRLTGPEASDVAVTAEAVHCRPMKNAPHLYLTGFKFVPGRVTGVLPQAAIDHLIAAVTVQGPASFFRSELPAH